MKKPKITADYHVHCGQYYETYYQPSTIIKSLYKNGIKEAWISSTTSCIEWTNLEEKEYLLKHIEEEITEAVFTAKKLGIELTPLYWVIPKRHFEGDKITMIMDNSLYKGFKIHPRIGDWNIANQLFEEICHYASNHNLPILIHTGTDNIDSPKRFETYFSKYKTVKFILAHCKDTKNIIKIFSNFNNVCGDTAFCPKESYEEIKLAGFKDRIQFGTDFPITHWFEDTHKSHTT